MKILGFPLFLILFQVSSAEVLHEDYLHKVKEIAEQYFSRNVIQIFTGSSDLSLAKRQLVYQPPEMAMDVVNILMNSGRWSFLQTDDTVELIPESSQVKNVKASHVVIIIQQANRLEKIIEVLKQNRILGYQSMVLVIGLLSNYEVDVFLKHLWSSTRAINVSVLNATNNSTSLYTWSPYHSAEIMNVPLSSAFPDKIPKDFGGHKIVAAVDSMEPYVLPPKTPLNYTKGVEVEIIKIIADFYNFSLSYTMTPKGENSRVVFVNGKTSGLFGLLNRFEADVAFAGMMRNPDRFVSSEVIYPHTEDKLVWSFPRPISEISWTSLYRAFSAATWLLIGIFIILNAGVITILGTYQTTQTEETVFQSFSTSLLTVWGVTVDAGFPKPPKTIVLRTFVVVTFIYAIIVSCSYKSCLVTFLTTPMPGKPISSVVDALELGYNVRMHASAKQSQKKDDPYWNQILIPGKFFYNQDTYLNLQFVGVNRTSIYLAIYYTSEYIQSQQFLDANGKPLIHYFKETFNLFSTSMFMSPGHPLEGIFNLKTMQLVESGIVAYLLHRQMVEMKTRMMYGRNEAAIGSGEGPQPLSLKHLYIVFAAICLALAFCIISLCCEIVFDIYSRKRKRMDGFAAKLMYKQYES